MTLYDTLGTQPTARPRMNHRQFVAAGVALTLVVLVLGSVRFAR